MSKKILIAEDEVEILQMFKHMLEAAGYEVNAAADGEEALALLRNTSPDLVLLDIKMPKKTGFEVLESLKAENRIDGIKIIVLSNIKNDEWIAKAKALGAYDYWLKLDTHLTELVEKIKALIGQ